MKILRKIIIIFLIISLIPISLGCYLIWNNNRTVAPASPEELSASLEKSIQWLVSNRTRILEYNNHLVWWMIKESAEITYDQRLSEIFDAYKKKWLNPYPNSPWQHLFDSTCNTQIEIWNLEGLSDYHVLILYGLTCGDELEQLDVIARQKEEDFCRKTHPISPACITHQLLGIRFMERRECGDQKLVQYMIKALQDKIVSQLTWDPRVVDVYIQRVLMLTITGAKERIKPIWLRNIMEAQFNDGGWSDNQYLIPFWGTSRYFCFTGRGVDIQKIKDSFHATAQGVFIMSCLVNSPG